jgi:hypothetical protein
LFPSLQGVLGFSSVVFYDLASPLSASLSLHGWLPGNDLMMIFPAFVFLSPFGLYYGLGGFGNEVGRLRGLLFLMMMMMMNNYDDERRTTMGNDFSFSCYSLWNDKGWMALLGLLCVFPRWLLSSTPDMENCSGLSQEYDGISDFFSACHVFNPPLLWMEGGHKFLL